MMRYHFGRPPDDDYERLAHQMAEAQDDDHFPTTGQQRIAATLLEASARLELMDRRRLQLDLLDIAQRVIAGDSYAWPRSVPRD
jgi:hypothetical protein